MAKTKTVYVCSSCGEESITWQGRCPTCGQWNTFKEFKLTTADHRSSLASSVAQPLGILDTTLSSVSNNRIATSIDEFDRVLGGGIMPGSIILLGGEPGIGKSTLLLQVADIVAQQKKVIYFSGEESQAQVSGRARRLGITPKFFFATETRLPVIRESIKQEQPDLVIVDSIQTVYDEAFPSTPGSLVQVRECALQLQEIAKREATSIILVGHITKEGTVAGPKTLEHMVDVVLYLEGEPRSEMRILRSMKNRFGATYEVGLFELRNEGLVSLDNPSSLFIEEHREEVPGTALTAVLEGARPILVEVQSLVIPTAFGYPKRTSSGFDLQRLHILLAILESRSSCPLSSTDVFLNVVGGYKIQDRGADLAVCMALLSATSGVPLPAKQAFYGEVGLTGEIRRVPQSERRSHEVKRLGYVPTPDAPSLKHLGEQFHILRERRKKHVN